MPACHTLNSQLEVLPVVRMIQSDSDESSFKKCGRPSMVSRSNVAPDLESSVLTAMRFVAPAVSSAIDPATHGAGVSVNTGGLHLGEQVGAPTPAAEGGVGGELRPGDGQQMQLVGGVGHASILPA